MVRKSAILMVFAFGFLVGCETTPTVEPVETAEPVQGGAETGAVESAPLSDANPYSMVALDDPDGVIAERIIYFEYDRSDIPTRYLDVMSEHARFLIANPSVKLRLEGHADERGSREYNIGLGDRRAQAVRRILLFQGVANNQVTTVSYGEERPAADGHDETAYQRNRRVELIYIR